MAALTREDAPPAAPTQPAAARPAPAWQRWRDSTLTFLAAGYDAGARLTRGRGTDAYPTRLGLVPTILTSGSEAARVVYDNTRFIRHRAMPAVVQRTLLGVGGVQGLDGERHRARKQAFVDLLGPERAPEVAAHFETQLRAALADWEQRDRVVLRDAIAEVLCRAVCAWADVPLPENEVAARTRDLRRLFELADLPVVHYARARRARRRLESWLAGLVGDLRAGTHTAEEGTALHTWAWFREPDGSLLAPRVAAVELLNVLRPTVAITRFVTLAALSVHLHPSWRERLRAADADVEPFVQEVRRYYPFFPAVAGRVREPFEWRGVQFPRGRRVLLDLYATDQDPRSWEAPGEFRPDRFRDWDESAFDFVPQGGGDHLTGHRCPGEWITIAVMSRAVRLLVRDVDYDLVAQDLTVSHTRMPTGPASGFVIRDVRPR